MSEVWPTMTSWRSEVFALYRQLLRLQQRLPKDIGRVGTGYIREEFKKHKGAGSDHAHMFMSEWKVGPHMTLIAQSSFSYFKVYAATLNSQLASSDTLGKNLNSEQVSLLDDQQLGQLHELFQETKKPCPQSS